ncbi:hypothetical protein IWW36_002907 [Coemansia brasiliensis]|uniref:Uncharacterized protein n=1 Tax=Coemansia brasiliensis TaxID=2650707 RepID=A0A9W8M081_9FUNG|nr:hypothetical protein IWW36_002907 [Coemansia brasiliensis]
MSQTALPPQNTGIDDSSVAKGSADMSSDRPFPRISDKDEEGSEFTSALGGRRRNLRTCSTGSDFKVNATIPAKPARVSISEGRSRSKSRGQQQTTKALLGASGEATVAELQQRLELMTREKVSLETALEHEQERIFNQSRRMSGGSSPMPLVPAGGGAVSPRWARSHSRSSSVSSFGGASVGSVGITETLKADINSLRLRLADAERELVSCYNQSQIYKKELVALRQRLGMRVDDLYLEDPVPSTIRTATDLAARPRRSQSVSSGASSTASTPSLIRRGSTHYHEYFSTIPATSVTTTTPRRVSQRPRSVLLSPRRSMEDHHLNAVTPLASGSIDSASLFSTKSSAPLRATRNVK